ncbi:hypothetical protein EXU48_04105 [Occultella glacieicola]|uniref:AMIN-like domain-containing protein n=1 Tax=Occultella glacieicola TaxID=2518684 RepID=A0ABY2E752_9MICO|nr:hypothetical protein [Occultella glacieicola]TDE97385.1 hypothetical protein EXU48_04105 [Occultella glacieicola]
MKRLITVLLSLVLGAVLLVPAGTAATAAPYCGIRWGSLPESDATMSSHSWLTNVRTGRHACFDRIVFDVHGDIEGYDVRYGTVYTDGEGRVVPLRGGADLQIVLRVPAYDDFGHERFPLARSESDLVNVGGYPTFRQVAYAGSFEGQTTIGLGVRARLPFRVFILDGPGDLSRLVVDVAHRW